MGLFSSSKGTNAVDASSPDRDWHVVATIAQQTLVEQRKARRWGIFFKCLTFGYLFFVLAVFIVGFVGKAAIDVEPHTALVRVDGVIASDSDANANDVVDALRRAFAATSSKAVILAINSPGGSPVQSGYISDEIRRLKEKYPEKKLYAVISDLGASGGYYIAVAADEIYADKASLVGSIGVTASSFGFVEALDKLGVERRHFTAGEHKAFLDPFSPLKSDEKDFWQDVLASTHKQFISVVEQGRGDRLKGDPDMLYSGLIWNGEQAMALGLVDHLGSAGHVARDVVKAENIVVYGRPPSAFEEISSMLGVSIGKGVVNTVKDSAGYSLNY
ncbi:signal peptide peptidase SppA [bacterium]|nr:signal peptide peptidase SppA [bacterium]